MPIVPHGQRAGESLDQEVVHMVAKKAIEEVNPQKMQFISLMFVVTKKGGKWGPVLKLLNQYVKKTHFKMEDVRNLKDILQGNDRREQEIPPIQVEKEVLSVHLPTF